jgi:erythromycin esterase
MPSIHRFLAALAAFVALSARAQMAPNLGFDAADSTGHPVGWLVNGKGYEIAVDSIAAFAGRGSLRMRFVDSIGAVGGPSFAVVSRPFPLATVIGRRLRLSGYVRTEDVQNGYAGLWMRVDGPGGRVILLDNMHARGPRGTTPWTRYEIDMPVDSGATAVYFGALHPGRGTAWFDSLALQVVGPSMPRTVEWFAPEPRAAEDVTRLLTDAELAVHDDAPPAVDAPVAEWVRANARPVRSLGATDFSDLAVLAPALEGKRVVQLGESGHGVAEFDMAKVRLVKYLHERLGYDVIAFESSLYECDRANRNASSLTAVELMRACIFGVWHTEETLPLFEYIKQTQSTKRPLILTGFDEQKSSTSVDSRPAFLRDVVAIVDTAYARHVYAMDTLFLAKARMPDVEASFRGERDRFVAFYDSLATFVDAHRRAIVAALPNDSKAALIARQTARSMMVFTRQLAAPGLSTQSVELRDRGMADNLDFVLDELYPGRKVITWAHNFHIRRRANVPQTGDSASRPPRTMGAWVAERRGREEYVLGLYMYRGAAAWNDRGPYKIAPMQPGSFEAILHAAPWRYAFLDFSRAKHAPGSEWLWQPLTAMDWGNRAERMVPRDEYDGVLFIDTVHLPRYR